MPANKKPVATAVKGVASKLNQKGKLDSPVWTGPSGEGWNGGVTQSMIGAFLGDRERFYIKYILGLRATDRFNHRIEYGNMWHLCEENTAAGKDWKKPLLDYAVQLKTRYPISREDIDKYLMACLTQYPHYLKWDGTVKETFLRKPILQEYPFDVTITLPSGRKVRLKGKWDGVETCDPNETGEGLCIQENKTKGEIDQLKVVKQLKFDLQTMMYLYALTEFSPDINKSPGERLLADGLKSLQLDEYYVRYNVIRRPFSGGRGNIKQREASKNKPAETLDEYWKRVEEYFIEDPNYWFMRWVVTIKAQEVEHFAKRCLIPILEQMCDWYESVTNVGGRWNAPNHWMHPYGVVNPIDSGYSDDYESFIETGSMVGLTKRTELFEELK